MSKLSLPKKISENQFVLLLFAILGFLLAFASLLPISISTMGISEYFVFEIIPLPFWIGLSIIVVSTFLMILNLERKTIGVFIFSSILLIICFRMAFPIIFQTIPAYEPDSTGYITSVNSWVNLGIDFGQDGDYRHNYPLSFLIAFVFVKLGVPIELFFRSAPFFIYAIDAVLLYLICKSVIPEEKKGSVLSALCVFLFSFSSLGYWVTVHYCPDLIGSLFFYLCLYLSIQFAKTTGWSIRSFIFLFTGLFLLILSHHLSVLYLIVTFFGFAISLRFFKPEQFKKGATFFFIIAIITYTTWFAYGSLVYPSFFNVYVYFSGFTSVSQQSAVAGWLNNVAFAIYPAFILGLFIIEFLRVTQIRNPVTFLRGFRRNLHEIRIIGANNSLLVFFGGFVLVAGLFVVGFGLPVLFGTRILEVLFIGMYPFASESLLKLVAGDNSRKRKFLLCIIVLLVVITGVYRYYSQIQRRVII